MTNLQLACIEKLEEAKKIILDGGSPLGVVVILATEKGPVMVHASSGKLSWLVGQIADLFMVVDRRESSVLPNPNDEVTKQ